MRQIIAVLLLLFCFSSVVWAQDEPQYPERVPAADRIAVFPFSGKDLQDGILKRLDNWARKGARAAGYDTATVLDIERLSEGENSEEDVQQCEGDLDCYLIVAESCALKWVVSGNVQKTEGGYIITVSLGQVDTEELLRKKVLTVQGDRFQLKDEIKDAVAALLLGPRVIEAPVPVLSEPQEVRTNEILAYDITKWTALVVGLGLAATGITFDVLASQKVDDYNEKAKQYIIDRDLYNDAKDQNRLGNALIYAGGAAAGISVIFFFLDGFNVGEQMTDYVTFGPGPIPGRPGASVSVSY